MRVVVSGATGFIGGYVARLLADRGHEVMTLGRAEWRLPLTCLQRIRGHDALINCVGILRERGAATFARVHAEVPRALFASCGIPHLVQISALGAAPDASTEFLRSKSRADELGHTVLRPSLVYGPGDHSMRLFSRLAALPLVPLPGDGSYRVQPIHVFDLARAAVRAVERGIRGTFDAVGGESLTFAEVLDLLARAEGKRRACIVRIPWWLMRVVARATDLCGRGLINSDELRMLRAGSCADVAPFARAFGFTPRTFAEGVHLRW